MLMPAGIGLGAGRRRWVLRRHEGDAQAVAGEVAEPIVLERDFCSEMADPEIAAGRHLWRDDDGVAVFELNGSLLWVDRETANIQ
jgi:hypothetical protein